MSRAGRVELWLTLDLMPDPNDMATWTISGRPLTAAERRTLMSFTLQDAHDAVALMRLSNELSS
jgi:hypothetical protein